MPKRKTITTRIEPHHLPEGIFEGIPSSSFPDDYFDWSQIAGTATDFLAAIISPLTSFADWINSFWGGKQNATDFIEELSIGTALIENLAVTNAKINSIDAGKITTGYLNVNRLEAGTITALKLYSGAVMANRISASHLRTDTAVITQTAQIADGLITSALIFDGTILNVDIGNAQIYGAIIKDAAITEAKIENAAVTNLKIASGTIEFDRVGNDFPFDLWIDKQKLVASFEALIGYDEATPTGSAGINKRKNQLQLYTGTTQNSLVYVRGYPIVYTSYNPIFRARIKASPVGWDFDWEVLMGTWEGSGIGFMSNRDVMGREMYLWNATHTVNTLTKNRVGLRDVSTGESSGTLGSSGTVANNKIRVIVEKVASDGSKSSLFTTAWAELPTTRGRVTINHSSALSISAGEALLFSIELTNTSTSEVVAEFITQVWSVSNIDSFTWQFLLNCWQDTGNLNYFYYGACSTGGYSYADLQTPLVLAVVAESSTVYQLHYVRQGDAYTHILSAKWEDLFPNGKATWYYEQSKKFEDDYIQLANIIRECEFRVYNYTTTDFTLEITNYSVIEEWA